MKKKKKQQGRGALIAVFLLTVVIFGGLWGAWGTITDLLGNPAATGTNKIALTIEKGETTKQIAEDLQAKGLVRNALVFQLWARLQSLDTRLQAGVYSLTPGMNVDQIIAKLQDGKPDAKSLFVQDGWRLEQIANMIDSLGLTNFDKKAFLNYAHHPDQFPDKAKYSLLDKRLSMEGLLFPDTYDVPVNYDTVQIIDMMLDQITKIVKDDNLEALAQQHKMTVYELITMASIVQREAGSTEQMPLIAGIIWNRVYQWGKSDIGGPRIKSDPTVEYAYDTDHPPVPPARYWKDLNDIGLGEQVEPDSPWNTYTHDGWPITPISSPNEYALKAAGNPQQTNCFYFLTTPKRELVCEATYPKFQADVNKYLNH